MKKMGKKPGLSEKQLSFIAGGYALLVFVGGVIGHLKAGSAMSLLSGICFGIALFISATGLYLEKRWGSILTLILTASLLSFFGYRYFITHAFMPAGLMLSLSTVLFIIFAKNCRK